MNCSEKYDAYARDLTTRVHRVARDLYDLCPDAVESIINEALFNISLDLRQGRTVSLSFIGTLRQQHASPGGRTYVALYEDPCLSRPLAIRRDQ